MNQSHYEWLKSQIPILIDKKIISSDTAQNILKHYDIEQEENDDKFNRIVTFIGVIFIGLGLLLVLAYNWDNLTRASRLSIAVGLLFISQIAMFLGIVYNKLTNTYKESLAAFQSLMIGASISLVGQNYEIALHLDTVLLIWMFLILPLAYLTRTVSPAILYSILNMIWLIDNFSTPQAISVWLFIILLIPIYRHFDKNMIISSPPLAWLIVINSLAAFILTFEKYFSDLMMQCLTLFFCFLFVIGSHLEVKTAVSRRPLTTIGVFGLITSCYSLIFSICWQNVPQNFTNPVWSIILILSILSLGFSYKLFQVSSNLLTKLLLASPIIIITACLLAVFTMQEIYSVSLASIYLLAIGLLLMEKGFRQANSALLNMGMLLVSFLVTAKFFDSTISFWNRGIAFIIIGFIFILINFQMIRQKKNIEGKTSFSSKTK